MPSSPHHPGTTSGAASLCHISWLNPISLAYVIRSASFRCHFSISSFTGKPRWHSKSVCGHFNIKSPSCHHLRHLRHHLSTMDSPFDSPRKKKKNKKKQFTIRFTIDSRRFTSMHHSIHHAIHRSIRLNPHVQQMTPAICQASFSICAQVGETSDGLSTTQFPAAMAAMQGAKDRWKGKFQAPRTKTT